MNEKAPEEAERGSVLRMSSPWKKVARRSGAERMCPSEYMGPGARCVLACRCPAGGCTAENMPESNTDVGPQEISEKSGGSRSTSFPIDRPAHFTRFCTLRARQTLALCALGVQPKYALAYTGASIQSREVYPFSICDLGLRRIYFAEPQSPTGPRKLFKEVTAAHVGCHYSGFPGSFLSGTLASYGASTVARTSGRGHVSEV